MTQTTIPDNHGRSPAELRKSEPYQTYFDVPVAGGAMRVARAGPPPGAGRPVVLAIHGMTGSHMGYRTVARQLAEGPRPLCVLVPDLRGRGYNAELPEPYGVAAHIADLMAVLDHAGVERAVVVGHSMGCNVAARFAEDHPDRVTTVVLLDGGLPLLSEDVVSEGAGPHGTMDRFEKTYATADEYVDGWRQHPALQGAWDEDVEAFVSHDYVEAEDGVRCVVKVKAVGVDLADMMFDGVTWTSVKRVRVPVRVLRAERGLFDDDAIIPLPELEEFLRGHPHVDVETVPDVNHFTLLQGPGHGPRRVASTLAELAELEPRTG